MKYMAKTGSLFQLRFHSKINRVYSTTFPTAVLNMCIDNAPGRATRSAPHNRLYTHPRHNPKTHDLHPTTRTVVVLYTYKTHANEPKARNTYRCRAVQENQLRNPEFEKLMTANTSKKALLNDFAYRETLLSEAFASSIERTLD